MSLTIDDVKYFVVVSETLNITRASEIIGISQPTLSYVIKRLENKLGGKLLIRLKNGIQLTKLGENFKQSSKRLIHEWARAQNMTNPESNLVQGSYTLAMHPSVALCTMEHFMPKLQKSFPALAFNFIHGLSREMTEKIISWEADFGIIVNPIQHPDLVIKKLYNDEVSIFFTPGAQKILILDQRLTQSRYILKKIASKTNFKNMFSSVNLEVVAKLTSIGLGYGILPTRVASQYSNLKKLEDTPIFEDQICLTYRPEKHYNVASQKIIKIIHSSLKVLKEESKKHQELYTESDTFLRT